MTVPAQTTRNVSTAVAGATAFPYGFKIVSAEDLLVSVNGVTKALNVDYTVSGAGATVGGTVTFVVPMLGGETVLRKLAMVYQRSDDYQTLGDLQAATLNNNLDAAVLMIQQLAESDARSLKLPLDSTASAQLPAIQPLKPLVGNAAGDGFAFGDTALTGDMLLRGELASEAAGKGSNLVRWISATAAAVPRWLFDKLSDHIHVKDFGAKGDGVTDDTAAILAAIAYAKALGGAIVDFHAGIFLHSSTLVVDSVGVILKGRGCGGPLSGGGSGKASVRGGSSTRLLWVGASGGIMYKLTSNAADDGSVSGLQGNSGIQNMTLDGNEAASVIVEIRSWSGMTFDNVQALYANTAGFGWKITTLDNGVLAGAADTQHGRFISCSYSEVNSAQTIAAGVVIGKGGSTQQGNVSLCSFYNLHVNVESAAMAMSLEGVDNLHFYFYRGQNRTGAGGGGQTVLHGGDTGLLIQHADSHDAARYCMFWGASASIVAKESINPAYSSSFSNQIFGLTRANGLPAPIIELRASLTYWETGGSGSTVPQGGSILGRRRRGHMATATAVSLSTSVDTALTSFNSVYNTEGTLGTAAAGITVPNGVHNCSVEFQGAFAVNGTGYRQVTLLLNGAGITPGIFAKQNAAVAGGSYVKAVATDLVVNPGNVISMSAQQNSGAALNLTATDSWLRVRWL